ncbi:hypothetical protein MSG28_009039 [Choristoneura fumiferana]|uniref:Uncharacterized protein n=1 Tax=Choristoneura fumiferana TaxID=7141 RepID=A0ACC0KWK3_CHOFU|nr:hypothetical protein MSG28_009039 [Choristoneura fumiferana]
MPKIPNLLAFGKHCHNCGEWMQRRALRKDDNFNYCKCCGLETIRQLRRTKARALSNLFPKQTNTIQPNKSQDLFDDFEVDNEELTLIEESLVTDDVSLDNEKKQESMLSVSSDFISLEEEEKENISNGGQNPEET